MRSLRRRLPKIPDRMSNNRAMLNTQKYFLTYLTKIKEAMRKLTLLLAVIGMLFVTSCGNSNKKKAKAEADAIEIVDDACCGETECCGMECEDCTGECGECTGQCGECAGTCEEKTETKAEVTTEKAKEADVVVLEVVENVPVEKALSSSKKTEKTLETTSAVVAETEQLERAPAKK